MEQPAHHRERSRFITSHIHLVHIYLITCECHPGVLFARLNSETECRPSNLLRTAGTTLCSYREKIRSQLWGPAEIGKERGGWKPGVNRDGSGKAEWTAQSSAGACWVGNGGHGTTDDRLGTWEQDYQEYLQARCGLQVQVKSRGRPSCPAGQVVGCDVCLPDGKPGTPGQLLLMSVC